MEAAYSVLQKEGKTDVDSLVRWVKASKAINSPKDAEESVRRLLNDVVDKDNVTMEKFKTVIQEVSLEYRKDLEGFTKRLVDSSPKILEEEPRQGTSGAGRTLRKTFVKVVKSILPRRRK